MNDFFTVEKTKEHTNVIERSKFICNISYVDDEEQAKDFIKSIKKKYSLATHNCYAYICDDFGLNQKFSDDGEPQGTAGLPMLEVLKNKNIKHVCAVVTRFFGGVKLGTGGLTRAYSGAVADCLNGCVITHKFESEFIEFTLDYDMYSKMINQLKLLKIVSTDFSDGVTITLAVKTDERDNTITKLNDTFNGKVQFKVINKGFYSFD